MRSRVARPVLSRGVMKKPKDPWAIPLEVILWTTYSVGLNMVMVVVLMN